MENRLSNLISDLILANDSYVQLMGESKLITEDAFLFMQVILRCLSDVNLFYINTGDTENLVRPTE